MVASDVKMPRMDGYELAKNLREKSEYNEVPILLVSSLDEKIDKLRGFDAGADDYLEKPFSSDELLGKVEDLLKSVV
jgi:DNA-binding response OmpR family regulator